ncbi:cation-translocating P-type ATPase [Ferruginibacter sp. HRS2-29]|uniref:heavy metal translocating P-type ATPase n=1 Tax=Ferruginibacter sp. HRS2-29 TaxID=2487334 RepID=UPI0020CC9AEB|nr:cation-translocating P-type ATPase [Ferruginibacter sp. HRS2-29]MCP9752708.1 cadmium-translocating P-type ATPase [Ferruginibacter sp. HRS2-29]
MEQVDWTVEGMTCSNCALSVNKLLQKEGMKDIKVNPIDGGVSFTSAEKIDTDKIKKGISSLGYHVKEEEGHEGHQHDHGTAHGFLSNNKKRFLFTLPFTLVLMLHMLHQWLPLHWLMNPWVQLVLCLPVFITGMWFFGRSAIKSLRNGMPNMDVLIAVGALASFAYSLTGAVLHLGEQYLFFETTASIITLVFMGNYLEEASIQSTQKALKALAKNQKVMANMIAFDDQHQEQVFPIDNAHLKTGDLVLIKTGEQVPADCKILWGDCSVNEAVITGESVPVTKGKKDLLIGGSILENGVVKAQVTAAGKDTVLSGILKMVQNAQSEKPPMQKLADKISAIFVPLVIGIAAITFLLNYFAFDQTLGSSLMRSVAVLVISCPCAMGLATPAAIAVGLGRAAKTGILFRNASSLESFKSITQVVFDKTGTLTTGNFIISGKQTSIDENEFKKIAYSLEKYSNHPIAKAVTAEWQTKDLIRWKKIEEIKGLGVRAEDNEGNVYEAGSFQLLPEGLTDANHNIFILKNKTLLGWIDVADEIRAEAKQVISWLHSRQVKTILLSGDRKEKCREVAAELGIDEVYAEQTPEQKLEKIAALNAVSPTAMIGDGINDAPALAKATLGISLSDASQIAMQSADVVLMNHGLKNLPNALGLGKHTYLTIKQNLFWAFAYNIVAIPIAAIGLLSPTVAALAMGFSDIVLAGNSLRLFVKKVV